MIAERSATIITRIMIELNRIVATGRRPGTGSLSLVPVVAVLAASLAVICSCNPAVPSSSVIELGEVTAPGPEDLRQLLDDELEATMQRRLNAEDHAAWQILHGALAYHREFFMEREPNGQLVSAVDYLLDGGRLDGWTTEPGIVLGNQDDRRGLRVLVEPGTQTGQGHPDQWFAILAQCGLEPVDGVRTDDREYSMADLIEQVQWDVPRNLDREFSWTLIGLTSYLPTDASWIAQDGDAWSIERLMEIELEHELSMSACGGSHRLIGLSMALNQHQAQQPTLDGVWQEADDRIQTAIANARRFQNPDGSFSSNYFERPGSSPDLAQDLGTTGHVLEFLTLATTDEQIRAPWIERAVVHLCELFRKTRQVPLECGALYHAAHGLVLYRQRVFDSH
jgi:hypothetical protein